MKTLREIEKDKSEMEREKTEIRTSMRSNSGKSQNSSLKKSEKPLKRSQSQSQMQSANFLINLKKKSNVIKDFKKFQTINNNNLQISFWEYFKFNLHKVFRCCKKAFKEELFMKAQGIYEKEIDIVNILQRLHDIEKLKLVFIE